MTVSSGRLSDYQVGIWIAELLATPLWWAIFWEDPHSFDPLVAEISGGAFARPDVAIASYGTTGITNDAEVLYTAIPAATWIRYAGLFDAATNGNLVAACQLVDGGGAPAPVYLPAGGSWTIPDGEFVAGIDVPGL